MGRACFNIYNKIFSLEIVKKKKKNLGILFPKTKIVKGWDL